MSAFLYLPTGLTFSDIRPGLPPGSLEALNAFLTLMGEPTVAVGDNNPLVLRLNDFDMGGASFHRASSMDGLAKCGPIDNTSHLPEFYIDLIVDVKGDIEGLYRAILLDDPDAEVPETFPNRTYMVLDDPEDPESEQTETVHTWNTWGQEIRPDLLPKQVGSQWYRSNGNPYNNGDYLLASKWNTLTTSATPPSAPEPE